MPGGPDDDDENDPWAGSSTWEAWSLAQNLSPGDEILVNGKFAMEIVDVNRTESRIECVGKRHSGNGGVLVLRLNLTHASSIVLSDPDGGLQTGVKSITPIDGTILTAATAESLLPADLTGENSVDPYLDQRDSGVEFSENVTRVGDCPCGGDIGQLDRKVVCESCGRWVPVEVWNEWTTANASDSYDRSSNESDTEGDGSGNRSLGDYQ